MRKWLTYSVPPEQAGLTVETILRQQLQVSGRAIQRLTRRRGILLNGRAPFLGHTVKAGDELKVLLETAAPAPGLTPIHMALDILFEDEQCLALNKPAGIAVHPGGPHQGQKPTLAHGVAYYLQQKGLAPVAHPVHRLDRDTSGVVLFAKHSHAHHVLDQLLRSGKISRYYQAIVLGQPPAETGEISAPIGPHPHHPQLRAIIPAGQPALTRYRLLQTGKEWSLLELELVTGRTHQIRVHLSHLGCPILGDKYYGGPAAPLAPRPLLHCQRLVWPGQGISAPLPADFRNFLK
ncbi:MULTISPECIES: RluA family pseudouridine synthase [Carboxydocella]|uniref:Pseudouridine synthase n=2 Tax=Carboxydocella TaxID=178898 RepID=A0A1T4QPN6_9FIRM|nr:MULTISPECIES: RluA family pseudouridine synthase [Carboxydocella]AVX21543.1 tRNA/rRNA pseudouridine synthase [Carboxydocella thermautotrophica]GAW27744.1 RNA pseudouridine synthase [Carboxydocella sp. ULO1]GAW31936.1 RNA pseudouridine synthase [Carboxydocella sp. JDF658]SKA05654.1 23S rRNA pseudouridine1911/1915/1917 synthase [Carboxydocella sporoproducens DSM 16521]